MKHYLLPVWVATLFVLPWSAPAQAERPSKHPEVKISSAERKLAENITAEQLKDYLTFISSDDMGGRDTPSAGQNITAQFLALNLKRWGFKPGGDSGTYFQRITVNQDVIVPEKTTLKVGGTTFVYGRDYYRLAGNASVEGPFVYARNGWLVKSKGIDAYAGVDVKDKIVVIHANQGSVISLPPVGVTAEDTSGQEGENWASPLKYAALKGAKALVVIAEPNIEQLWKSIDGMIGRSVDGLETLSLKIDAPIPVVLGKEKVARALFAGEAGDATSTNSFEIKKSGIVAVEAKAKKVQIQNVVAIWEGQDRKLKDEFVAVGAHYDHIGTGIPEGDEDVIYNGADDDGSGTVALLSMAEALGKSKVRAKRSLLFVWHTGEEKGQWGSKYFTKYPTVDLNKIVAQLNIDMIGRSKAEGDTKPANKDLSRATEIYVIGSNMMSSTLDWITRQTNRAYTGMDYNHRYDDPNDPNKFFFRSDHFYYAQNGIPIVFWFDGVHEDYHQPSDEIAKIDFAKYERVARTIFLTLLKVADLDQRPAVDRKLPPELTVKH